MEPRRRNDPGRGSDPRYPGSFLLTFREAIAGLGWQVRRWKGNMVECSDAEGNERVIGLENLYRRARLGERSGWPQVITDFLQAVGDVAADSALPERLEDVAGQLLVRVGPPLPRAGEEARVWSQRLEGTDLWLNLVVDYPNRMCYVTEELVEKSGRPGGAWLETALANLRGRTPADGFQVIDEEMGLRMCGVADAYDSSRALLLDRLLPGLGPDGLFVALPGRDALFVLPVTADSLKQVHFLKLLAEKNYQGAPYPISREVYWVRAGTWCHFPIQVRGQQITVEPPPDFMEVLSRLLPEEDEDSPAEGSGIAGDPEEE